MQRRTATLLVSGLALLAITATAGIFSRDEENAADGESGPATRVSWEALVPADFVPPEDPYLTMTPDELKKLFDGSPESESRLAEIDEAARYAPTVPDLDGRQVSIPGYVVPLDFDGQRRLEEFLLVPYYGACIHTPPPPANQIVFADSPETIEVENLYDPVWITGTLRTSMVTTDLAEAGYRMDVTDVEPFVEGDQF